MILAIDPESEQAASRQPIPHDVRKAVTFMRRAIERPVSIADLVEHCGVAERTLNKHFRAFLGVPPMDYLRRLRLVAAREALLAGKPGISVTDIAKQNGFNHFGRFAGQYRRTFGESPSVTLRQRQVGALSSPAAERETTPPRDAGRQAKLRSREKPSVAILPCQSPANEPVLRSLAEGVADAIGAALCSIRSLAVMLPPTRRAAIHDPQRVARELNARYVLSGRAMHEGPRLRLLLSLVDTASGHHVWGDSFDGKRERPLELQDLIVTGVMRAVPPRIRGAEIDRAQRSIPQNLDAYGLAMRALPFVFASNPDATRRALDFLHRAIEFDPDYGLATALAAWCHGQLVMYNGTSAPAEERERALQLVRRAAILDDDDPLVLAARCAVHTMANEFDTAAAIIARALARDPSSGWAWGRSGWLHAYRGCSETAIDHFGRAIALDRSAALRANSFAGIGSAHFNAGRYEAAAFWLRRALREQPGTSWANRSLSVSYARMGERLKALESLDALRRFSPNVTVGQVVAAVPFRPDFLDRLGDGLSALGLPP